MPWVDLVLYVCVCNVQDLPVKNLVDMMHVEKIVADVMCIDNFFLLNDHSNVNRLVIF